MKLFWTVFKIYGASKRVFKVLTEKLLALRTINIFECMEIAETIYEGVVEPSHKND